jgi:hypothetical protein
MARLPSEMFLIQQIGSEVILFEEFTEHEIVRFDPGGSIAAASALEVIIAAPELGGEDKAFACFWAGYFHFYAGPDAEMMRTGRDVQQAGDGTVSVMSGPALVVSFDPGDANAAARAQKNIYDSALIENEKARAHFWCGFFYGQACGG